MYLHDQLLTRMANQQNRNVIRMVCYTKEPFISVLSVPFKLIRCARGGGVSQDIENVSLEILAQKCLEEGLYLIENIIFDNYR